MDFDPKQQREQREIWEIVIPRIVRNVEPGKNIPWKPEQYSYSFRLVMFELLNDLRVPDTKELMNHVASKVLERHLGPSMTMIAHNVLWASGLENGEQSARALEFAREALKPVIPAMRDLLMEIIARRTICAVGNDDEKRQAIEASKTHVTDDEMLELYQRSAMNSTAQVSLELIEEALPIARKCRSKTALTLFLVQKLIAIHRIVESIPIEEESDEEMDGSRNASHYAELANAALNELQDLTSTNDSESKKMFVTGIITLARICDILGDSDSAHVYLWQAEEIAHNLNNSDIDECVDQLRQYLDEEDLDDESLNDESEE
ncbi:MAG TPA: hypothetical protein VJB82_01285 [Candidatus Peribacterales bacterium]|nr:hypothetical protein [Candidatus Peribacterales bacterium]